MSASPHTTAPLGSSAPVDGRRAVLIAAIEQAAHLLPSQGPIQVFVHHNTLHAFEHLSFGEGVESGGRLFGCHAYLPEAHYRDALRRGRIREEDLDAVLQAELGDEADRLVATFGTRYALRLAMLQFPIHTGPTHELRWVVAETEALRKFRHEVNPRIRDQLIQDTKQSVLGRTHGLAPGSTRTATLTEVLNQFGGHAREAWPPRRWEAFVLNYLWRVCRKGVLAASEAVLPVRQGQAPPRRHRDILLEATGEDADLLVNDVLIRFSAAFVDQGFSDWDLPARESGLFQAFLTLYAQPGAAPTRWYGDLQRETRRLQRTGVSAIDSIAESLRRLGVPAEQWESFIADSLLALRGWSGMIRQMETNAEWAPRPIPVGSLVEFVAVRLLLDRLAALRVARDSAGYQGPLDEICSTFSRPPEASEESDLDQTAFIVFQLAQLRGWKPNDLELLSRDQWQVLIAEIRAFDGLARRRIYHHAYERKYRNQALDAIIAHAARVRPEPKPLPLYQVVCCLDDREESFRRHLEEVQPACQTFGLAGFFGVAMYYRGVSDAHFTPLCPVNVKPEHFVVESPVYSSMKLEHRRADARRRLGYATHRAHLVTRSLLGGALAGVLGSLAVVPLVTRVLFPRTTSQIRGLFSSLVRTHATELQLERLPEAPAGQEPIIGYRVEEMAAIVEQGLRAVGLGRRELLSRLLVIAGHGSGSRNNPHEAAYNCGACGGGRGGPNARAFAQMANDPRVRQCLKRRGLAIPDRTVFVGAYHNTCDDSFTWYDLDRIPIAHRELFEQVKADIDEARRRNAHERCRRFESADLSLSPEEALRHVENRSEDLSQTRPECGHATNALCIVGRREWSRGLFLDRRAFLTSYDPNQDDERNSTLEQLLRAVIPVCAGINLEYYFSYIDSQGYGCGTKLPHNIASLLGVMDGAASDLRPGLPWQMVEIHEPVRLLFVVETNPRAMLRILADNPGIARLVRGGWVQLALFDPASERIHRFVRDEFVCYAPHDRSVFTAHRSIDWYRGQRDHLDFASIIAPRAERPKEPAS